MDRTTFFVVAKNWGDTNATLYGSDLNYSGQLGLSDRIKSVHVLTELRKNVLIVAAGSYHSYTVDDEGRMFATGQNMYAQLGLGAGGGQHFGFEQVTFPGPFVLTRIAAGNTHGRALNSNKTLYMWGFVGEGATGQPCIAGDEEKDICHPTKVDLPSQKQILDFCSGGQFSAVVIREDADDM
ncbi:hypothetical protein FisN_2Lu559 [Fistulifera solaris]|uniref:Uncharacterized protein n=1 Tax=Fistulifera solaris TaxID=1519565 RepID=A0A1Z5JAL8_FISSO|nr:hypothetical protein FisN_2Lu559 [Fistulifera solaris]|eukprot:GAX11030.1 hypothetical protein FisN_2Lu559 [Fistulifera solaris]